MDADQAGHPPRLEESVGATVRELRQRHALTMTQLAEQAELSCGMLSKIETGQVSAGLDTLARIARALGVPMSVLFSKYDAKAPGAQHVKRGAGMEVMRRGTRSGHAYRLLAYDQGPAKLFEPLLISMDDASQRHPTFQHAGSEFIYMLEGELVYRCGQQTYLLEPGDALSFPGDVPHGPERLVRCPIRFLSVIVYPQPALSAPDPSSVPPPAPR